MPPRCVDPLLWFTFRSDDGPPWEVYLATEKGCPAIVSRHGVTDRENRHIILSLHHPEELEQTFCHEVFGHVVMTGINREPAVRVGQIRVHVHHRTEERIVRLTEPRVHTITRELGWRLPRKPRGYMALLRKADRLNELRGE